MNASLEGFLKANASNEEEKIKRISYLNVKNTQ